MEYKFRYNDNKNSNNENNSICDNGSLFFSNRM